jgi:hypothetical protein
MDENDLRNCFAMFAMMGLTAKYGNDNDPETRAKESFRMADAMLIARNEEDGGIVSIRKKRYEKKESGASTAK